MKYNNMIPLTPRKPRKLSLTKKPQGMNPMGNLKRKLAKGLRMGRTR